MNPIPVVDDARDRKRLDHIHELAGVVMSLLDTASHALEQDCEVAKSSIGRASSLLQVEFQPQRVTRPDEAENGTLLAWQSRRVIQFIDRHIETRIRVSDLGKLMGRSEAHFSRAFKRTFGEPPHAYILRRRMELARHLMLASDASLSEIALNCGLTDQAHLCKLFRASVGQTPSAWRRARTAMTRLNAAPAAIRISSAVRTAASRRTERRPSGSP